MNGIMNLPQFDTEYFETGRAVRVTWSQGEDSKSTDCLVVTARPESLEVCYWDSVRNETQFEFILATHVVLQQILVEVLTPIQ